MGTVDLRALLTRLEAASGGDRDIDRELEHQFVGVPRPPAGMQMAHPSRFTDSLDRAVGLVEKMLPGWRWVVHNPRSGLSYGASVSDPARGGIVAVAEKGIASAPLAVCAALLKALIAQAETAAAVRRPAPVALEREGTK